MSGDPEQEYFTDGISEDILTALSKLRWFFVIARNSPFTYKGKAVDVKRTARELGERYVLEGSVRKGGNRVRITAQLIDAATGNHIWADSYDGDLSDVFGLQDEIIKKVVSAIEPKLLEPEAIHAQGRSPDDLGAWDLVIHANSLFWRMTKNEGEAAIAMLEQAVERYPDYAPGHSMLAFALLVRGMLAGRCQSSIRKSKKPLPCLGPVQISRPAPQAIAQRFSTLALRDAMDSGPNRRTWGYNGRAVIEPNRSILTQRRRGWANQDHFLKSHRQPPLC